MSIRSILRKYKEYFTYIINSFLIQMAASRVIEMSLRDSVLFAAITLGSFLFINKIFLKIFRFRSGNTVRQQLRKACPVNKRANGMINIGNLATYEDYLFSGCKKAGTCDGYEPDVISEGIINKTEHCGAWDLKSTGLRYNPVKGGWRKEKDCAKYNKQASYLPDQCMREMWKGSGCTNVEAADKQYNIWKKNKKGAIVKDLASWKSLTDNTHRTLCYGPDKSKWPKNICNTEMVVKTKAIELGDIGMKPWGLCPGFLSPTAKWIGPKADSATWNASPGFNGYFIYEFLNEDEITLHCTLNVIVDDSCTITVNNRMIGTQSGGWGSKGGMFPIVIKPGLNRVIFRLFNAGNSPNPTAILAAVMHGKKRLFHTDSTWTYAMSYPCGNRNEDDDVDCSVFTDKDINLPAKCQKQMWSESGCLTPEFGSNEWWYARTKNVVKADMNAWATMTDDHRRRTCYTNDRTRWPNTSPKGYTRHVNSDSPGQDYHKLPANTAIETIATACNANADCAGFNAYGWLKNGINNGLSRDLNTDLYLKNDHAPSDAFCKSRNPTTAIVKSVRTSCRVNGCNAALGGTRWTDYCNAGNGAFTCCGTNSETEPVPVIQRGNVTQNVQQPVSAVLGQHCGRGQGWQRPLKGKGSFQARSDFPWDSSYITVMPGNTATVFGKHGWTQVVRGPGAFNFCSRSGFNDSVHRIDIK